MVVAEGSPVTLKRERFLSLDVFRGLTVCLMIIVNTPGPGADFYAFLTHAPLYGFTLADLVFPSFLFAVGNSLSFSRKDEPGGEAVLWAKILKRTILLFGLGYLMYWFPFVKQLPDGHWVAKPFSDTRIMGVLQRIALCYGLAALLVHYVSERTLVIISAGLLLGYWALLYFFGEPGQELTKTGNAGTLLDRWVLGTNHMYKRDGGVPFDPEGLLGTLPALVNVLAGYLSGTFIRRTGKNFECVAKLLMVGALLLLAAQAWNLVFPIAKKLWTSPFALHTIGLDLIGLALLVYAIEMRGWTWGTRFFNVFGKNPLFIYLFSEILVISINLLHIGPLRVYDWIGIRLFQAIAPGPFGSLLCAVAYTLVCWLVGWVLDRRRIYIRL